MTAFVDDMTWSAAAFRALVWPIVNVWCGGGEIKQVEGQDANLLDMYAGVDAWQVFVNNKSMRGIASRIQYNTGKAGYPYNTFSIRTARPNSPTEYEKRLECILSNRGLVYPHLTVQAYLDASKQAVQSVAVCRTKDLFLYVDFRGLAMFRQIRNTDGSSTFIVVKWSEMVENGVHIKQRIFEQQIQSEHDASPVWRNAPPTESHRQLLLL